MNLGTPVTNAKGWHGKIVSRPAKWAEIAPVPLNDGSTEKQRKIIYVEWEERKDHPGGDVLPHRPEQVWVRT